jgi:phasin family protein
MAQRKKTTKPRSVSAKTKPRASASKRTVAAKAVSKRKTAPRRTTSAKKAGASRKQANTKNTQSIKSMEIVMNQGKVKFDKIAQEASKASKENMDVLMKSGNIFFKGYEDVMKTWMSWAQSSAEKNSQAVKTLMSCKTLNELTEAHNKLAQQNFDDWMNGTTKISEQCVKLLTEAMEPINDQFGKAMKSAGGPMAM